ncbi:peptidase S10, serine carboxypeptidase [Gigaspora margarita]|uniref:Carboxypeptidase n=1 Tax=Gigaspora margarita TaxID=4874 RepID=A0A8H3ZZK5_GIGMA|nr:peptidase S10, serine carboxypeptidase [Gigaspora margarita]
MVSPKSLRVTCLVLGILILCNLVLSQGHDKWKKTITNRAFPEHKLEFKEPTICDKTVQQYSGYFVVNETKNFFFWFFESRNKPQEDPLVLWVNGGPGCSSLNALFLEVGPCRLEKGGNGTIPNPYSWNSNASIIFLDQPTNTGYSYGDNVVTTSVAASDIYAFIQLFFHQFTNYTSLDFHIAGESYAGHFIPAVATEIVNINKNNTSDGIVHINLESVLIGNGAVDPEKQLESCPQMACNSTYKPVLTNKICNQMSEDFPKCASEIEKCNSSPNLVDCFGAVLDCYQAMIKPYTENTNQSLYDIRRKCDGKNYCYSEADDLDIFANLNNTKTELGVDTSFVFRACNISGVFAGFTTSGDVMLQFDELISQLLESKIRVLIYAGDADYLCNWYGIEAWVKELQWSGKEGFNNANVTQWMTKDPVKYAGDVRTFEGFTFLKIFEAGHMAPYDNQDQV